MFLLDRGTTFSVLSSHSGPFVPLLIFVMGVNKTPSLHLRPYHFPEFLQNDSSHTPLVRSTCLVLLIHHHIL